MTRSTATVEIPHSSQAAPPHAKFADWVEALPQELGVCVAEVRTLTRDHTASRQLERASLPGYATYGPIVDDTILRAALEEEGPTLIDDLRADPALRTWIVVPLAGKGIQQPYLLLGTTLSKNEVTPNALRAMAALRPAFAPAPPPTRTLLKELANAVPVPAAIANSEGQWVAANDNFLYLFGCQDSAWEGSALASVLPQDHHDAFAEAHVSTLRRASTVELPLPPVPGVLDELVFTLTTRLVDNFGQPLVVFVLREVSTGLALCELRENSHFKDLLLRWLVHDIKNPLSAISNGVSFIRTMSRFAAEHDQDLREILDVVENSVDHVQQLIEDFGEFTSLRFQRDDGQKQAMYLDEIIDPILEVYRLQGLPHRFEYLRNERFLVRIEPRRFSRALDNLLSNAVKYSPSGGTIRVALAAGPQPGWVQLTISDEGLGIATEYQEKIWEPLYRQDDPAFDGIEGSGLGLSIVRHVIAAHGGELDLTSRLGEGSTFRIALPTATD